MFYYVRVNCTCYLRYINFFILLLVSFETLLHYQIVKREEDTLNLKVKTLPMTIFFRRYRRAIIIICIDDDENNDENKVWVWPSPLSSTSRWLRMKGAKRRGRVRGRKEQRGSMKEDSKCESVWKREREREGANVRESVSVCERVCGRERESESMLERVWVCLCKCEYARQRECKKERNRRREENVNERDWEENERGGKRANVRERVC